MVTFRSAGDSAKSAPTAQPVRSLADYTAQITQQLRTAEPRIPPYPAVAGALDKLRSDGASLTEVTKIVASDASLAAAVLRRASAAAMRVQGALTLEAAISRLGISEIVQLVLATGFGASAMKPGPLAVLRRDMWRRSVLSATFCKELAHKRGVDPEQAFLSGLLHDFGAVIVIACIEAHGDVPKMPEDSWRRLIESLHVEIGMIVAARWKLPEAISDTIAHHTAPMAGPKATRALVELVALTDRINDVLERGTDGDAATLLQVTGLAPDEREKIARAMPKVAEQLSAFEVPKQSGPISSVERETTIIEGGWPVDFRIEGRDKDVEFRCVALGPSIFTFTSPIVFPPSWLADLTLHGDPEVLKVLANVKTCEQMPDGQYMVTAQPFGLGGDEKKAWLAIVSRTRRAAMA
ncbi:MAG TPA: HDOD domain-containing protein [Kofleriaceae bacterium]